jgi:hypothetical protein
MSEIVNGFFAGNIAPSTTVAGCVEVFENVWPDPDKTIKLVEERVTDPNRDMRWEKASTFGGGMYQDLRTNKHLGITHYGQLYNDPVFQNIHNQFHALLLATTRGYRQRFGVEENFWPEDYNLLKYSDNQFYGKHYDGTSHNSRALSAICYLNNDYEGGELEFVNFKIKIKPEPGMLILFPSSYAYSHIAHPIVSGTKYAIVTWLRDQNNFY